MILYLLAGIVSGFVAGILGIGGGLLLVPFLVAYGVPINVATGTSLGAVAFTSTSGTIQNYLRGAVKLPKIFSLALPSMLTVSIGALAVQQIPSKILTISFAVFLLVNIFLVKFKRKATATEPQQTQNLGWFPRVFTGLVSGVLAGVFGVGGGVILVPLQIVLLGEEIKGAVVTSLGVIVLTSVWGTLTNFLTGNILFGPAVLLGIGGVVGITISSKLLVKLPEKWVEFFFAGLMLSLSGYMITKII